MQTFSCCPQRGLFGRRRVGTIHLRPVQIVAGQSAKRKETLNGFPLLLRLVRHSHM